MTAKLLGALAAMTPWTPGERQELARVYAAGGIHAARRAFPHRSRAAIYHAAKRAGATRRPLWTRREDERLRIEWGSICMHELVKLFGRPRDGIYVRARALGLPSGCPRGLEYLSHAANRSGYTTSQLRRILRWAGVSIKESYSRTSARSRGCHVVDPLEVDDAIVAYLKTETLHGAARRYGVSDELVRRRLRDIGIAPQKTSPLRNAHHRIESEKIDAAMRGRAA